MRNLWITILLRLCYKLPQRCVIATPWVYPLLTSEHREGGDVERYSNPAQHKEVSLYWKWVEKDEAKRKVLRVRRFGKDEVARYLEEEGLGWDPLIG